MTARSQRYAMIQVAWEFVVKATAVDRFEQAYGAHGPWTRLFRAYPGYRGTTLLRAIGTPRRYLTIDVWDTRTHRRRMMTQVKARYAALDKACADLIETEREVGVFTTPTVAALRRQAKAKPRRASGVSRRGRRTRG
jgi:heme-degrading monooxygenase HmoA